MADKCANRGTLLAAGEFLHEGQYLSCGEYYVLLEGDGNLSVHKGSWPGDDEGDKWSSDSPGEEGDYFLAVQADGNVVIYHGSGSDDQGDEHWSALEEAKEEGDYFLIIQPGGDLAVFSGVFDGEITDENEEVWKSDEIEEDEEDDEPEIEPEVPEDADNIEIDLEDLASRYNSNYYCEALKLEIDPGNHIKIHFHVHGNMSLGRLQPAQSSRLYPVKRGNQGMLVPTECEIEEQDPNNIKGILTFAYKGGPLFFQYGRCGYSRVQVFAPTPGEPAETELEEIKSQYNDAYYCEVPKITLIPWNKIEVEFHVHGDMSLGRLQPATSSRLRLSARGGRGIAPKGCEIEEQDPENIKGKLIFDYPGKQPLWFTYGRSGYSRVQLIE